MEGTFMNESHLSTATQFLCQCGKLIKPENVEAETASDVCTACGTDAPLLYANEHGQMVSYSSPMSPEMQVASDKLSRLS